MIGSPRTSLGAILTALAVVLTGGLSAAAHCPPSHHDARTVACCPAQADAVKSTCLHDLECLVSDREAVRSHRNETDLSKPGGTAAIANQNGPAAAVLSVLLSLEDSSDPPRGSSVRLHLLNAVFLS